MRRPVDDERVRVFLHALARSSEEGARVDLTGGATAVLYGWRPTTIAVDLKIVPERDSILRAIPRLKDDLEINRYPAIDARSFRRALAEFLASAARNREQNRT